MGGDQHILWVIFVGILHVLGVLSAIHAFFSARSSQSAIAWAISCITFPYFAVPAYWVLGRNRFRGYVFARRSSNARLRSVVQKLRSSQVSDKDEQQQKIRSSYRVFEQLAGMPFMRGNRAHLLVDGDNLFESMFHHIEAAKEYVLIQFYIVRDDALGQRLLKLLKTKADEGVRVYFMYDQVGSHSLSRSFVTTLRDAGVKVRPFKAGSLFSSRFQINFRNHRKVVLVDGNWVVTGGANLGEEYRGQSKRFGYWRDTMIALEGPAVQEIQVAFAEDWFFLTEELPKLNWEPIEEEGGQESTLVLPTGPADEIHACSMMFTQAIHSAVERLWITSPYFVPDTEIIRALQLAALRGVDVRILLPDKPDHMMVYWASYTYLEELERTGVRFFRYTRGMLHEKVVLADDRLAFVGSANTDNRSFYLNFEITVIIANEAFAAQVLRMLENDFSHSVPAGMDDFKKKGFLFHFAARLSRLLSPIL